MKKQIKITLIFVCLLIFLFCLSGVFMAGSFSVNAPAEQKEHYDFVLNVYKAGVIISLLLMTYLTFFIKTKKD